MLCKILVRKFNLYLLCTAVQLLHSPCGQEMALTKNKQEFVIRSESPVLQVVLWPCCDVVTETGRSCREKERTFVANREFRIANNQVAVYDTLRRKVRAGPDRTKCTWCLSVFSVIAYHKTTSVLRWLLVCLLPHIKKQRSIYILLYYQVLV